MKNTTVTQWLLVSLGLWLLSQQCGQCFYDPGQQRWINRDPIQERGGLNLYGLVANNPINCIDILGLVLSNPEVAGIIFNETRSLSGNPADLSSMYQNLAHVIMNGDAMQDASGGKFKRPKSASTKCKPGPLEQSKYKQILSDVTAARAAKEDPTDGALDFNLRPNNSTGNLFGADYLPLSTQNGPFNNRYTAGGLPTTGVYVNTYFDTRYSEP
jgi:RHS repeat-associated protein